LYADATRIQRFMTDHSLESVDEVTSARPAAVERRRPVKRWVPILSVAVTVGCIIGVLYSVDLARIVTALRRLEPVPVFIAGILMTANLVLAYVRFEWTLRALGAPPIKRRTLVFAFTMGNLASQFLLNVIGQSFTRAAILRNAGLPIGLAVTATYLERLAAAVTLGLAAVAAAFILFGSIHLDLEQGGGYFLNLAIGLPAVVLVAGGWAVIQLTTREGVAAATRLGLRLVPTVLLGIAVHATSFAAFLILIFNFAGHVSPLLLGAAIVIVMFVTSIPISFAGWGLREFSAAYALGAIGVAGEAAVVMAATVGALAMIVSLAASGVATLLVSRAAPAPEPHLEEPAGRIGQADVALILPIGILTACLIFFQLRLPVGYSRGLTVNAADVLALTSFCLAVYFAWTHRFLDHIPPVIRWGVAVIAAVLVFGAAVAWFRFGGTNWGLVNRLLGFPILLGFAAAAGLVVLVAGERGRNLIATTFVLALMTIIATQVVAILIDAFVAPLPVGFPTMRVGYLESPFDGFAQDRNAFTFQMLMALAVLVAYRGIALGKHAAWSTLAIAALAIMIVMTRSRSGVLCLLAAACVAVAMDRFDARNLVRAAFVAVAAALALALAVTLVIAVVPEPFEWFVDRLKSSLVYHDESEDERWGTIWDGVVLWLKYPFLGGGLGAYVAQRLAAGMNAQVIHNVPIWFMAEFGLVGLAAYLGLIASFVTWGLSQLDRFSTRHRAKAILFATTVFFLMGLIHDIFYQRAFWFVLGLFVTDQIVRASAAASRQPR
jgi:Lysylphosphatidylglycerol synthase TM region/O-Antigen ligase